MNAVTTDSLTCPADIPVLPLKGALLLPRGQMPLNIFEPRYVTMIDDALKTHRVIGIIQPHADNNDASEEPRLYDVGCAGRITQFSETDDGRYLVTVSGISRFRIETELGKNALSLQTPYRRCLVTYADFPCDLTARSGEKEVDRTSLVRTLKLFTKAHDIKIDWRSVDQAANETLVNALSMICPFGAREKQALLEAVDLKTRADVLIAITEIELARDGAGSDTTLQ